MCYIYISASIVNKRLLWLNKQRKGRWQQTMRLGKSSPKTHLQLYSWHCIFTLLYCYWYFLIFATLQVLKKSRRQMHPVRKSNHSRNSGSVSNKPPPLTNVLYNEWNDWCTVHVMWRGSLTAKKPQRIISRLCRCVRPLNLFSSLVWFYSPRIYCRLQSHR